MSKFLDFLKTKPNDRNLFLLTIFSFLFFIIIMVIMAPYQSFLVDYTIIDFEFSWNGQKAAQIMQSWGEQGLKDSIILNYIDFAYMIAYGLMGFGLGLIVTRRVKNQSYQEFGIYISILPIVSALFDVVENINLLILQYNPSAPADINAFLAAICATIKFSGLIIALIYFLITIIYIINQNTKR